ncbi:MAG: hypothetical protein U9R34_04155 [Nanoarchaeota archaeon]|nr:hypothetical protein [Nanoarchaeota archaeon]
MISEKFKQFVENFDVEGYIRRFEESDYYKEKFVPKINNMIKSHYQREIKKRVENYEGNNYVYPEFSKVKITQKALDKGKYISKRVCEFADSDYEIYMYMIGDNSNKEPIVDDFYIGIDQTVEPDYCKISPFGKIRTSYDITDNLEKRILGWSHSHGSIDTFHSRKDRKNLQKFVASYGLSKKIDLLDDEEGDDQLLHDVYYTPSLVFNKYMWETNILPFAGVALDYTKFGNKKNTKFHLNDDVEIEVIKSDPLTKKEMEDIDEMILDRVNLKGLGKLRDIYEKRTLEQNSPMDNDISSILEEHSPDYNSLDKSSLIGLIRKQESKYKSLFEKYGTIVKDYNYLQDKYHDLKNKNSSLRSIVMKCKKYIKNQVKLKGVKHQRENVKNN